MYKAVQIISPILAHKTIAVAIVFILGLGGFVVSESNYVTYKDPVDAGNYMVLDHFHQRFTINQNDTDEPVLMGDFYVSSDTQTMKIYYVFKFDGGFSQRGEIVDSGHGVKSPAGNVWVRV